MGADSRSRLQLDALARVAMLLEEAAVDYWLFGGWAVDFYAGYVSRAHDDVDLAVWLDDLPHVAALLEADGWRHAAEADEDGGTGYERDSVRLELTYLARDDDGVYTPLRSAKPYWSEDALADDTAELEGVRSRAVSLAALARTKSRARSDAADAADAAKDGADSEVLGRIRRRG